MAAHPEWSALRPFHEKVENTKSVTIKLNKIKLYTKLVKNYIKLNYSHLHDISTLALPPFMTIQSEKPPSY